MQGLCSESEKFLEHRIEKLHLKNGYEPPEFSVTPLEGQIVIEGFSVSYSSQVRRTYKTHAVQQAFDISPEDVVTTVLKGLEVRFSPGEVILILGPSGSGKSSLLDTLQNAGKLNVGKRVEGQLRFPGNYQPGAFVPIRSRKPLIELIGEKDVRTALYLLGLAGLSEPVLYLKRFEELSRGQQYRAMLAKLITSKSNVWIADEFCTNLDAATAGQVSDNVQRIARKVGATVIAAAPHCENFIRALRPDKVILLTSNWEYSILSGDQYLADMDNSLLRKGVLPRLRVTPDLFLDVKLRTKKFIVRKGRSRAELGILILFDGRDSVAVRVTSRKVIRFSQLSEEDALNADFQSLDEMKGSVLNTYPNLTDSSEVTLFSLEFLWRETPMIYDMRANRSENKPVSHAD